MTSPPVISSLPLSQQIVAWALRALGYGDKPGPGVSRSTLRSAQAGKLILETWNDLVASMLRRLGAKSLPDDLRTTAQALLRKWDLMVGELPLATGLSLAERLHAPLACALPAVGIRLGAVAASVALATRTPIAIRFEACSSVPRNSWKSSSSRSSGSARLQKLRKHSSRHSCTRYRWPCGS